MSDDITVAATSRKVFGKGASRRLRRDNLVPAILYGDSKDPEPLQLKQNEVQKHLENEAFYSQLLMVKVDGGEPVRTILRDVQRHPYKQQILHMDFLRVVAGAELQLTAQLHFTGEDVCPGVKDEGGVVAHNENEVAIACLPRNIPEYIEVDMSAMRIGDSIHLSDLKLPEGVRLLDLNETGDDSDRAVAAINKPRTVTDDTEEEDDGVEPADTPTDDAEGSDPDN